MKAVILCGGKGTRIRDVSEAIPKPMLPIGGRPILWHIMKVYAHQGVNEFVLCLGYKGWVIKEFFLQYRAMMSDVTVHLGAHDRVEFHGESEEADWKVSLVDTGEMSETGARVWQARKYIEDSETFFLTYGDGVADVDLKSLIKVHDDSNCTGILTGVRPAGRFGELDFKENTITAFNEKPNAIDGFINGGYMRFKTDEVFPYFRRGADLNLEQEVLPKLVQDGKMAIYKHNSFWQCMDTFREYKMLNDMWEQDKAPWKVWA